MDAQQGPIAPIAHEVPAEVLHELFSKATHEINLLALLLTKRVTAKIIHPRVAHALNMLGLSEQWKEWINDDTTRCCLFETFIWYEVAQYFGTQHRDIWGGKIGGAFKDVCKQLRNALPEDADIQAYQQFALWRAQGAHMITQALGNNTTDWNNLTTVTGELFTVLKTYLPDTNDQDPEVSATNFATLHYRLINIYSLAVRMDDIILSSKNPMFIVYGRPKRFDATKMWPSVVELKVNDETPVKFQISPSVKMKVQVEEGGPISNISITKAKVCV
ncbi:hypothetical protein ACHAQH_005993 [Verticillium albo-atrum]